MSTDILIEHIKDAIFGLAFIALLYAVVLVFLISYAYLRYEILLPEFHHKISFINWLLAIL